MSDLVGLIAIVALLAILIVVASRATRPGLTRHDVERINPDLGRDPEEWYGHPAAWGWLAPYANRRPQVIETRTAEQIRRDWEISARADSLMDPTD